MSSCTAAEHSNANPHKYQESSRQKPKPPQKPPAKEQQQQVFASFFLFVTRVKKKEPFDSARLREPRKGFCCDLYGKRGVTVSPPAQAVAAEAHPGDEVGQERGAAGGARVRELPLAAARLRSLTFTDSGQGRSKGRGEAEGRQGRGPR